MSNITQSINSAQDVMVQTTKVSNVLGTASLISGYREFMNKTIDHRTKEWFLVDNPLPLFIILTSYLIFCTKLGPQLMKNRKPLKLTNILIVYNAIQIVFSAIIFHEGLMGGWLFDYDWKCQPVDYSNTPTAMRMASAVWYYYIVKLIDLSDTIFFVLRKKENQISFLHLYHHTIMPICSWIGVKWLPGGHGTLLGVLNSFVHIIMYGYYLLAALGPQYQKYLWWKKYLTAIQIIQFVIIIVHSSQLFIYNCDYPKTLTALLGVNTAFIMAHFTLFYVNSAAKIKENSCRLFQAYLPAESSRQRSKMNAIFSSAFGAWKYLFTELTDERTRGWFLVGSPVPILLIMFAYNRLIKNIGPEFMKNRPPFTVDKLVKIYNLVQIVLCGWLAFESFRLTYGPNGYYSWNCQPMDTSLSPRARKIATLTWIYYMIKLLDLLDTVFFVLRKKFSQVSFLHYYHHMGILLLGYMASTYYPDGQGFLIVPLNSFVHCFMYAYYFLANQNPEYKNRIWWKKHITHLQMAQFLLIFFQVSKALFIRDCNYPLLPVVLLLPQILLMLYLFSDFYYKTYIKNNVAIRKRTR